MSKERFIELFKHILGNFYGFKRIGPFIKFDVLPSYKSVFFVVTQGVVILHH